MRSLEQLARDIIVALERPEDGFVFDDFDRRYTAAERKHEKDAAAWFYRDKTSFETKYDTETDGHDEPSWVSDGGRGQQETEGLVSYRLDGDETARDVVFDKNGKRSVVVVTDDDVKAKRETAALRKAYRREPDCATTLKGILKHGKESEETICDLMKSNG